MTMICYKETEQTHFKKLNIKKENAKKIDLALVMMSGDHVAAITTASD